MKIVCPISKDSFGANQTPAGGAGHLHATLGDKLGLSHKKKPIARIEMARRDFYQRKVYAVRRMSLAVMRVARATSTVEQEKAARWARAWGAVGGIRQFKLGNGGNGNGGDRR